MKTLIVMVSVLFAACGNEPSDGSGGGDDDPMPGMDAGSNGTIDLSLGCKADPPPGAKLAAAPKPYAGTCPALPMTTTMDVEITSSGNLRKFWIVVPEDVQSDEKLPIIFLWHWLGGEAQDFFERGEVQLAVNSQRFLAVIPQAKGDLQFTWPATNLDSAARLEEDARFFDDMLSCVSASYNVNSNCVSSTGVSAGALWTSQLIGVRGDWIASFMSLSGGTGGTAIKPWKPPTHKMPGFVLWGGAGDTCGGLVDFGSISGNLEMNLSAGGHFFLECVHNCGHSVPPFVPPPGSTTFKSLWQFGLDHPYWLEPGQSPYNTTMPNDLPEWCSIGKGNAMPRTGTCADESQC